jgi:hypothetical protein
MHAAKKEQYHAPIGRSMTDFMVVVQWRKRLVVFRRAKRRDWHKASIRGTAAFRSVSDRSGHEPAGKTGCIGRE